MTAVVFDREISAAMCIDVARVMTGTCMVGAALATLAGALAAPKNTVGPGIGVEVIVIAFAVVVIGGLGSIPGAMVGPSSSAWRAHSRTSVSGGFGFSGLCSHGSSADDPALPTVRTPEGTADIKSGHNDWTIVIVVALTAGASQIPSWIKYFTRIAIAAALASAGVMILLRAGLLSFGQGLIYFIGA